MSSDLTDLNAIYLVILSIFPWKRKKDFLLLSLSGVLCAASSAASLLPSVRVCQAQSTLAGGLESVRGVPHESEEDEVE